MSTSTDTAEVVIVGGGLEGCATAWALAQRGVTDVVIVERATVGSGGTGKSSRRRALPLRRRVARRDGHPQALERLRERRGGPRHGRRLPPDRLRRRGRPENVDALHASIGDQRAVGVRTEDIDHADVAALWPVADLEPFAAFAWEERGGYGDAYQTAQAFAGRRAPRRCPPPAGHDRRPGSCSAGDGVTGVRARRRHRHRAGTWCSPPGRGRCPARRARRRAADHRRTASRSCCRPRPGPRAGPGVLRPGLAAVHPRRAGGGRAALRQLRPVDPRAGRPRPVLEPGERRRSSTWRSRRSATRFPGLAERRRSPRATPAATTSPPTSTRSISETPAGRARRRRRLLGARLQDRAGGRAARRRPRRRRPSPTPTSPRRTSGSPASPRATCCGAPTPTSAPARCGDGRSEPHEPPRRPRPEGERPDGGPGGRGRPRRGPGCRPRPGGPRRRRRSAPERWRCSGRSTATRYA